uniref:NADH-ubiquinone oxidoreductase chain 4 n=1 Tax=Cyrtanaspis phalerata TaxID=1587452 RepID=A0A343C2V3_9CUCU|nr:NADH dehydrogenase subunit 4 [Cyrtanaspis phalerata]
MMKFIFLIIMFIPLSYLNLFWLIQWGWMFSIFMFLISYSFNKGFSMVSYLYGMDFISFLMLVLSFWILSLMFMSSEKIFINNNWSSFFLFMCLILMLALFMTFSSLNMFIFYLFFEISLIPILILIMGWGYQPERLQAGIYLLFYTLLASLPMMISVFYLYNNESSMEFYFLNSKNNNLILYFCMNMVFFIKIPMFMVHLWLPKAHVEAPVAGSMILAGVMLKLGGYGLMRLMILFTIIGLNLNLLFISLSLIGGVIVSLVCLRQSDLKSLIAYSSIAHMGMALSGVLSLNYWGYIGCLVMMVAHGLCSSGLFCLANINYERILSRSLYLNKGLINVLPSLSLWWFLLVSSNMAAPPSLNLLGEIMLINSILSLNKLNMIFLGLLSFFSAVYSLYLYSFSQHGKMNLGLFSFFNINIREFLVLMLHWLPLNLMILKG